MRFVLRLSLFSILLLTASLLLSVSSKGEQTLTVGADIFPPGVIVDPETGHCSGYFIDSVSKIFSESNFNLDFICTSPSIIFRMLDKGKIDLIVNIKTNVQLDGLVTFVGPPYRDINISLFNHQDDKLLKTISAVKGYHYNGQRKRLQEKGFEFYDLPDTASALRFFMKKRSTYLLSYRASINYLFNKNVASFEHSIVEKKISTLDSHFAISNKSVMFEQIKSALHSYAIKNESKYYLDDDTRKLFQGESSVTFESQ
jgi:polar amino acid transport system substrate-binding protein